MKQEEQWLKAKQQAAQSGITLTRRKNAQGGYVCYFNKKARENWLSKL